MTQYRSTKTSRPNHVLVIRQCLNTKRKNPWHWVSMPAPIRPPDDASTNRSRTLLAFVEAAAEDCCTAKQYIHNPMNDCHEAVASTTHNTCARLTTAITAG